MLELMGPHKSAEQLDHEKRAVARAALRWVHDGMVVGLGTGSTAGHFITFLGEYVRSWQFEIHGVPSSVHSEHLAKQAGIPVLSPKRGLQLDVTIDGADEISPDLD